MFAAIAALGAGLEVAADTTVDTADLGPVVAAAMVAIPDVVFLMAVAILHARGMPRIMTQVIVVAVLILATALTAPSIGMPTAVVLMALLVCGQVALAVATLGRQPA